MPPDLPRRFNDPDDRGASGAAESSTKPPLQIDRIKIAAIERPQFAQTPAANSHRVRLAHGEVECTRSKSTIERCLWKQTWIGRALDEDPL